MKIVNKPEVFSFVKRKRIYYYFRKYEQADKKGRNIIVQNEVKGEEQGCLE